MALAGPREPLDDFEHRTEGVNIVLLVDVSTSMAAEDFKRKGNRINRLEIVKDVVKDFVQKRPNDRIGLIAFAAKPYVVCPLTTDHNWLEKNLERIRFGLMEDGTAIGSAIASGVNRLRNLEGPSQVVILLTDGVNNAGSIDPIKAAEAAESFGVKVYTIGVGTRGLAPYPTTDFFGRKAYQNVQTEIDEGMLKKVARISGGQYFRATDTASLEEIYARIDEMETVKIEEKGYQDYRELFSVFLGLGLFLLLFEIILSRTVFLKLP